MPASGTDRTHAGAGRAVIEAPLSQAAFGVNVVGYFRSEVGDRRGRASGGRRARRPGRCRCCRFTGRRSPSAGRDTPISTATPEDAAFPLNLICMNADVLPEFARQAGEEFFAGRYSIGLWFWEVAAFPERWRDAFSLSRRCGLRPPTSPRRSSRDATVPVTTVRIPVQPPDLEPRSRTALGVPEDKFVFLFSFDYLSVFKRKNPLAVDRRLHPRVRTGRGSRAASIKCINQEHDPDSHAQLRAAAGGSSGHRGDRPVSLSGRQQRSDGGRATATFRSTGPRDSGWGWPRRCAWASR